MLDNPVEIWSENTPRPTWASSGATVGSLKNGIDANIALHSVVSNLVRNVFLINIGINETAGFDKATFKSNYKYIIDALVAKWSDAEIFLVYPWARANSNVASLHTYIDEIISENPGVCFAGHDEAVWLEGGDDGATMTYDGVHYSTAGQAECANQWKTILGY